MPRLQIMFAMGIMLFPSASTFAQRPGLKTEGANKQVTEFDAAFRVLEGKHKEAGAKLEKAYDEEIEKIRVQLTDSLSTFLENETKIGNLDQAIEIRDAIKFYKSFDPRDKQNSTSIAAIRRENAAQKLEIDSLTKKIELLTPNDHRTVWMHSTGYFVKGPGNDWFEKWGSGKKNPIIFKEIARTPEYIEIQRYFGPALKFRLYTDRMVNHENKTFYKGAWSP